MDLLPILLLITALVPGAVAWWTGRRLVRRLDDPALPERLQARARILLYVTVLAFGVSGYVHQNVLALVALVFLGIIVGGFSARRQILEEQWGLPGYLLSTVRFWVGWLGVWLLLALAPVLISGAGTDRWPVAIALAAILLLWNAAYGRVFLWVVGARPLTVPPRWQDVLAQAHIGPQVLRFHFRGGVMPYAFAVPSVRRYAVLFSQTILDHFDPHEQAAIFAHEVAHLEYYTPRRLILSSLVMGFLIGLNTFGVALVPVWVHPWVGLWSGATLFILASALARRRHLEDQGDRRAVALCGDPDALIRALVKLHTLARMPRRLSVDAERWASHPSLARRIQSIRQAAGTGSPGPAGPAIVAGAAGKRFVIFESDRVLWVEGVPPETPREVEALRNRAALVRSVPYAELQALRVKVSLTGGASLVATDQTGRTFTLPLGSAEIVAAQRALDMVDVRLGPIAVSTRASGLFARVVALLLMVSGLLSGLTIAPLLTGLAGLVRPSPTAMLLITLTAVAGSFTILNRVWKVGVPGGAAIGSVAVASLVLAGLLAWGLLRTKMRGRIETLWDGLVPVALVLGGSGALLVWMAVRAGGDGEMFRQIVKILPDLWIGPLAAGVALLARRSRPARWVGAVISAGTLLLLRAAW